MVTPSGRKDSATPTGQGTALETAHIAFVGVPQLLQDLSIGLLAREHGLSVEFRELDIAALPAAVAAGEVEVLISGPELAEPRAVCRLLMSFPGLKALAVIDDGRRAVFSELRPNHETHELSTETLVAAVRSASRSCVQVIASASPGETR